MPLLQLMFFAAVGPLFAAGISSSGIYNSSKTPSNLPWDTYNYCNAPHVNAKHYILPTNDSKAQLVYMNVVMRHHKRTPDNLYPSENSLNPVEGWDCSDFINKIYVGGTAQIHRETFIPTWHPYVSTIWNGTCDAGQLTRQGLDDAVQNGKDFRSVYHQKLGFLTSVNEKDILLRTSTELRTHHVASGLLYGMDPATTKKKFPVHCLPASIDSIPPSYPCPNAETIRAAYQSVPAWMDHIQANQDLQHRLEATLGTTGLQDWSSWYDHYFDTFTSRTCHGHSLPCNSSGTCVSQDDADKVFALGDFEYNYIWNAADKATDYVKLTFGVFFSELAQNFKAFLSGSESYKLRFYVGHDGTMIRLAAGLGIGKTSTLRWPGLGSEIVMEVWRTHDNRDFVRVMHEGKPIELLQWVPLNDFIGLLEGQVPKDLLQMCTGI